MSDTITPLVLDMLEWIAAKPRPYSEVMDAWRTSCPRLTVWEEANDRGFIAQRSAPGQEALVELTPTGRTFLERQRPEWAAQLLRQVIVCDAES